MKLTFNFRKIKNISLVLFTFLLGCDDKQTLSLPGYIDADYIYISSSLGGKLKSLLVRRGEVVDKGQKIFSIDQQPQKDDVLISRLKLLEALENLKIIKSDFTLQKSLFERNKQLYQDSKKGLTIRKFDASKAKFNSAKAKLNAMNFKIDSLKAMLDKAEWKLKQKTYYTTFKALIFDTYFQVGEHIPTNRPIVSLLKPDSIKVVFYAPEPLLNTIKLNQSISLKCDGCIKNIKAKITYISPSAEYNPPVIYSSESRSKLTFKVEAAPLVINALTKLHPGLPLTVMIE